jgi:hypothetical protein
MSFTPPRSGGHQGEGAKQENLMLKAYYSHLPVSQEYFALWTKAQGAI